MLTGLLLLVLLLLLAGLLLLILLLLLVGLLLLIGLLLLLILLLLLFLLLFLHFLQTTPRQFTIGARLLIARVVCKCRSIVLQCLTESVRSVLECRLPAVGRPSGGL